MGMDHVATVQLTDLAGNDDAFAIVAAGGGRIALNLSTARNGDVDLLLSAEDLDRLLLALRAARQRADAT